MIDWAQRDIWVLGLGESGLAMARWAARQGARSITVTDTRAQPPGLATLTDAVPQAKYLPADQAHAFAEFTHVALSPGLSPRLEPISGWLARAAAQGAPVWGEIEWFAQALADGKAQQQYAPTVVAVTGTNGKTTVARLTGLLLQAAGRRVCVAGNVHPSALSAWLAALDAAATGTPLPDAWVLELSSFQLHALERLPLTAAAWLNLTQDHLDWHGDLAAYGAAKSRIFAQAGLRIVNRDDPHVMKAVQKFADDTVRSFGAGLPQRVGDLGVDQVADMAWLVDAPVSAEAPRRSRKSVERPAASALRRLMPSEALRITGQHNLLNAQAALLLARAAGADWAPLLHALRNYGGEPHRMQYLCTVRGVDYVDDSKATNVGATAAALAGLKRGTWLIAGGDGKGQDFQPLAAALTPQVRAVLLIGRDAPALAEVLAPTGITLMRCTDLPQAVQMAAREAQAGEQVLLSPACASLDMFRDYRHRAEVFADAVRTLAQTSGVAA